MSIAEQIEKDYIQAYKAKDQVRLGTLRLLKTAAKNKQVEKAGVLSEMKKRQHYEKPSVMRKKKKAAARKRLMKKMRKVNMG